MHEKRCCKDKETKAEVSSVKPNSLVSTMQLNPADGISRVQNFLEVKRGSPFAVTVTLRQPCFASTICPSTSIPTVCILQNNRCLVRFMK